MQERIAAALSKPRLVVWVVIAALWIATLFVAWAIGRQASPGYSQCRVEVLAGIPNEDVVLVQRYLQDRYVMVSSVSSADRELVVFCR